MKLFIPITKVDTVKGEIWGRAAQEVEDKSGEIMDYATSKPNFKKWSDEVKKESKGKSLGNVRAMHGKVAAGKVIDIQFNDAEKAIDVGVKVIDMAELEKAIEGVYTGFSIGGKYGDRWDDNGLQRYTAIPSEISLVDRPCIKTALFELIKTDGTTESREFKKIETREDVNPDEGKKQYGDVEFADMKNKKYPIDTEAHIRAAWNYIGKEKNASRYSAKDIKTIKDKIIAAWKAKIDKDGPPSAQKGEGMAPVTYDLGKFDIDSVYNSRMAMDALMTVSAVLANEQDEGDDDDDAKEQQEALQTVIDKLRGFISSEITEEDEDDEEEDGGEETDEGGEETEKIYRQKYNALLKAISSVLEGLEKGDYVGHAFHGNQHVGAESAGKHNEASREAARASRKAGKNPSIKNHLAAKAAHEKAARLHEKQGNSATAALHQAMAAQHEAAAESIANKTGRVKQSAKAEAPGELQKSDFDALSEGLGGVLDKLELLEGRIKEMEKRPMPAKGALRELPKGASAFSKAFDRFWPADVHLV